MGPLESWCHCRQLAPPEKEPIPRTEALGPFPVPCPQSLHTCSQVTLKLSKRPWWDNDASLLRDTSSHCPEGAKQISPELKILCNSHSGKSASSWTGRKQMVAAESQRETTTGENRKYAFLKQNVAGDHWARAG